MKLVFLYGPPAVGKLTVAEALAVYTGLPLVDNHSLMNPLARVFGWNHPERERLGALFRYELFQSAAREGISLITTLGGGGAMYDDFIQATKRIVEQEGGEVVFVRLVAPMDVLHERVTHLSRSKHFKMTTPELLRERLEATPDALARALVGTHLELDTSRSSPDEMAHVIAESAALPRENHLS